MCPQYEQVRSAYDGSVVSVKAEQGGPSEVREAFKDEADINNIVARYQKTGQMPLNADEARFGDVSDFRDYKAALDFVREARDNLRDMPEEARGQYQADPDGFIEALEEATTRDDLVALGIVVDPEEKPPAKPALKPAEPAVEPPAGA